MLEGLLYIFDFVVDALVAHQLVLLLVEGDEEVAVDRTVFLGDGALREGDAVLAGHAALVGLLNYLDDFFVTGLVRGLLVSMLGGLHFEFNNLVLDSYSCSLQTHF